VRPPTQTTSRDTKEQSASQIIVLDDGPGACDDSWDLEEADTFQEAATQPTEHSAQPAPAPSVDLDAFCTGEQWAKLLGEGVPTTAMLLVCHKCNKEEPKPEDEPPLDLESIADCKAFERMLDEQVKSAWLNKYFLNKGMSTFLQLFLLKSF
jgi:hypothetical protein